MAAVVTLSAQGRGCTGPCLDRPLNRIAKNMHQCRLQSIREPWKFGNLSRFATDIRPAAGGCEEARLRRFVSKRWTRCSRMQTGTTEHAGSGLFLCRAPFGPFPAKESSPGVFSVYRFRPIFLLLERDDFCSPLAGPLSLECGGLTPLWLCRWGSQFGQQRSCKTQGCRKTKAASSHRTPKRLKPR